MTQAPGPGSGPATPTLAALAAAVSASRHATVRDLVTGMARLIATWHRRSRSRAQLRTIDDRLLRDIGLDRATANDEARKPFWRV
ncbi:DUF1127 domain-containing protein [Rhodospira trueperi]|uniref:Uncharacterized conserved protein YjiS, DUF1127 family n=1 Tax=Rhodospira trueperi TaxID=69960 RepID=A0A1G6YT30_9PROT|nr:DUF1127 domain-containing protein [Rhodospira trueperi]SDD93471.1 Uncharacterized conserved protein YjiS, DUF1127 family [Rhodospira trueperi]